MRYLIILILLLTWVPSAFADMVQLKTGQVINGEIRESTPEYLELNLGQDILVRLPRDKIRQIQNTFTANIINGKPSNKVSWDKKLTNWIIANVTPETGLPLSFYIKPEQKKEIYSKTGDSHAVAGIIERCIVDQGFSIYDGSLWQIVLAELGGKENLQKAGLPTQIYWQGSLGELHQIRAGFPGQPYVYDPADPFAVSSDQLSVGRRGFFFRIINGAGKYQMADPLDGKQEFPGFPNWPFIHWEDWKPITGENAWLTLASLRIYHKKYFDTGLPKYQGEQDSIELKLAEEIARAAVILQADNGGIRMAPMGTYHNLDINEKGEVRERNSEPTERLCVIDTLPTQDPSAAKDFGLPEHCTWHYYEISTENNLSWYAALRMLFQVTGKPVYRQAMKKIEGYFKSVWDPNQHIFYQGVHFKDGKWIPNTEYFATDVQNWAIDVLGPDQIDQWFGQGSAYQIWQSTKKLSGARDEAGRLTGVGYTKENDRVSVEWTCGAILATRVLSQYYEKSHPEWSAAAANDAKQMREGIDKYRFDVGPDQAAYAYSSRRGWIPFGWFSHPPEVLSLTSTAWVMLVDEGVNPFYLSPKK